MNTNEAIVELQMLQYGDAYDTEHTDFECFALAITALREKQLREKNEPLTWKDLAYMDGEPIWSEILEGDDVSAWEIFFADNYDESEYGVLWLAYLYGRPAKTQEGENDGTSNK